jgi:predicted nucleotidyltransferase
MIPHLPYRFIEQLKALPFVEAIYLYGSRARGDNPERADIDLAIDCPTASREEWSQVMEIVEDADTLLHVDCVRLDQLSEGRFRDNIERDKVPL